MREAAGSRWRARLARPIRVAITASRSAYGHQGLAQMRPVIVGGRCARLVYEIESGRSREVIWGVSRPGAFCGQSRDQDEDPVEAGRSLKADSPHGLRIIGNLTLCRSLLEAGLVDRFRVVVFPVITGSTGRERIYGRVSRRRSRDGRQPHIRRQAPAARVRAQKSSLVRRAAITP